MQYVRANMEDAGRASIMLAASPRIKGGATGSRGEMGDRRQRSLKWRGTEYSRSCIRTLLSQSSLHMA